MHLSLAWIVIACVGFALGLACDRIVQGAAHKRAARSGCPDVHLDGGDIVIANQLDEELRLVKIAANAGFALAFRQDTAAGSAPEVEHWFKRSRECEHVIAPRGWARFRMLLKDSEKPPVVHLTFKSSAGTLRREIISLKIAP